MLSIAVLSVFFMFLLLSTIQKKFEKKEKEKRHI